MMKNNKKIIIPILLTTMCIGIPKIYAYTFGVGYADTGGSYVSTPRPDTVFQMGDAKTTYGEINEKYITTYTCVYNYEIGVRNNITINGYDLNDKEIMKNSLNISEDNKIIAGTSLGLNIYETKTISWKVTKAEAKYKKEEHQRLYRYRCTYTPVSPMTGPQIISNNGDDNIATRINNNYIQPIARSCSSYNYNTTYYNWCQPYVGCNSSQSYVGQDTYYTYITTTEGTVTDPSIIAECQKTAANAAINVANNYFGSSYSISMSDSNDINGTEIVEITNSDANETEECIKNGVKVTGHSCKFDNITSGTTVPTNDNRTVTFTYKKNNVCIDAKTAKITYEKSKCKTGELKIENKNIGSLEHWHYFIPLNAKGDQKVEINLIPAYGGNLNSGQCKYVMENNPVYLDRSKNVLTDRTSYVDLIKPKQEGKNFEGNYCTNENGTKKCNDKSSDYSEIIKNGCHLTSKIKIPIKQEFYNELETTTSSGKKKLTFNGFNFYYKPIDAENATSTNQVDVIFPNGVKKDLSGKLKIATLWEDWYKAQTNKSASTKDKTPDLSKSYSDITYVANNINVKKIRTYNASNAYTSWSNMNTDGTSKFIDSQGIITRNGKNSTNIYKLGCGPANINEYLDAAKTKKNNLYIKGCES